MAQNDPLSGRPGQRCPGSRHHALGPFCCATTVSGVGPWPSVFRGQYVLAPSESQSNPTQPVLCLMPHIQKLGKQPDLSQEYRAFLTTSTQHQPSLLLSA